MPIQLQNHRQSNAALFRTSGTNGSHPKLHTATSFRKSRGGSLTVLSNANSNNNSGGGGGAGGLLRKPLKLLRTHSHKDSDKDKNTLNRLPVRQTSKRQQRRRHSIGTPQEQQPASTSILDNDGDELKGRDDFLTGMTIQVETPADSEGQNEKETTTKGMSSSSNNDTGHKRNSVRKASSFSLTMGKRRSSNESNSNASTAESSQSQQSSSNPGTVAGTTTNQHQQHSTSLTARDTNKNKSHQQRNLSPVRLHLREKRNRVKAALPPPTSCLPVPSTTELGYD